MLNTQWGTLIENVSKEVMPFIDLPKKHSGDGSGSNLFHEYSVYERGLQPSLQWSQTQWALLCGGKISEKEICHQIRKR